jgi:RsiW-degrading membrane proteinase PrsW (M82 family)
MHRTIYKIFAYIVVCNLDDDRRYGPKIYSLMLVEMIEIATAKWYCLIHRDRTKHRTAWVAIRMFFLSTGSLFIF